MKKLITLFAVGFLAVGLSGCSSTPKEEKKAQTKLTAQEAPAASAAETEAVEVDEAELKAKQLKQMMVDLRLKRVHFDFDKSNIKPEYFDVIKTHAKFMSEHPEVKVTIAGYCDERGTAEYNLALGERRANAAYNGLVAEGISPDRIQTVSYGESYPLDPHHNEEAWAKNRRATFVYGLGEFVRPH